jgi:hypothetical protein
MLESFYHGFKTRLSLAVAKLNDTFTFSGIYARTKIGARNLVPLKRIIDAQ